MCTHKAFFHVLHHTHTEESPSSIFFSGEKLSSGITVTKKILENSPFLLLLHSKSSKDLCVQGLDRAVSNDSQVFFGQGKFAIAVVVVVV